MRVEPLRALVDVNVILDVIARREPHYGASARVWAVIERGQATGLVAAHGITTLHYLIARQVGRHAAGVAIDDLLGVFVVAAVDGDVVRAALALGWPDFEDAVQMAAALSAGADCVVTRDTAGFKAGPVPAVAPEAFLALVTASGGV